VPKLTKKLVESAQPAPAEFTLWDEEIPGFGLRVWPSGKKTYIAKYRTSEGRQRKYTIGPHGVLTAERARVAAIQLLSSSRLGSDPAASRKAARGAPTIAELSERYLREHARLKKKASSVHSDEALLRLYILPRLGLTKVNALDRAEIAQLHTSMSNIRGAANRTLALLSKMMNLAEKWGLRPDGSNPCRHVEKYAERKIERYLSADELARLGKALADAEREQTESASAIAAIRLLLLTGCRFSEIMTLRWKEVDFQSQCLRLRDSKTGAKLVYLSSAAVSVLKTIQRKPDNEFVIAGAKQGTHLVNLRKPWERVRTRANLTDVRIHDLRHSFASIAVSRGLSLPIVGALLGHSQPGTTQRYAHLAGDPLHKAVDLVGESIEQMLFSRRQEGLARDE
jgi:integrase